MRTSALPVLYLNRLNHEGKVFIKFYYKAQASLTKKLAQLPGIKFSKQYNCFVSHYSPEQVQAIKQTLYWQAILETRYLHRKTTQVPSGNTLVTFLL